MNVQLRTVTGQVPVTLREVIDSKGRKTQGAEAVVHAYGEHLTVSLVKSDDRLALLMGAEAPPLGTGS